MRRYEGEGVREGARIAVIANDAIGNFVVATPLLQALRRELRPVEIVYYGGTRTRELQDASDLFERSFPLHGTSPREAAAEALSQEFELVVNVENSAFAKSFAAQLAQESTLVCGPCIGPGGRGDLPFPEDEQGRLWSDREWIAPDLADRYECLESGFIGEIYCRLCYLDGPIPNYKIPIADPGITVPDLLIAASASLPDKLWPVESWGAALGQLAADGLKIGLLGAPPKDQAKYWRGDSAEDRLVESGLVQDLRGKMSLPGVAGALAKCRAVLTLDNGILHMAAAAGAKTVGLFRHGIHRLWAPPSPGLTVLTAGEGKPVSDISIERAVEAVRLAL